MPPPTPNYEELHHRYMKILTPYGSAHDYLIVGRIISPINDPLDVSRRW